MREYEDRLRALERIRWRLVTGRDEKCQDDKLFSFERRTSERAIGVELGISRTPVREAVTVLSHVGILEQIPQVGIEIRTVNVEDVNRAIRLDQRIETEAAKDLQQWPVPSEKYGKISELTKLNGLVKEKIGANHDGEFVWQDTKFHVRFTYLAGYDVGALSVQSYRDQLQLYRRCHGASYSCSDRQSIVDENDSILNAVAYGRDEASLSAPLEAHFNGQRDRATTVEQRPPPVEQRPPPVEPRSAVGTYELAEAATD